MVGVGIVGDTGIDAACITFIAHVQYGIGIDESAARQVLVGANGLPLQPFGMPIEESAIEPFLMAVARKSHTMIGRIVVKIAVHRLDPTICNTFAQNRLVPFIGENDGFGREFKLWQSQPFSGANSDIRTFDGTGARGILTEGGACVAGTYQNLPVLDIRVYDIPPEF